MSSKNSLNASSLHTNVPFLFFHQPGEDEYTVVPDSKIVVSRTAFKDNSSTYTVNGKKATYKEVATLLRASGIDLDHNRFLILQVDINEFLFIFLKFISLCIFSYLSIFLWSVRTLGYFFPRLLKLL